MHAVAKNVICNVLFMKIIYVKISHVQYEDEGIQVPFAQFNSLVNINNCGITLDETCHCEISEKRELS